MGSGTRGTAGGWEVEGGGDDGQDGGLDLAGASGAECGCGAGEGAAGGGQVVDQQDPAAGQAGPGPGWRAGGRRLAGSAGAAGAAEVATSRRGKQPGHGEAEGLGHAARDPLRVVAGLAGAAPGRHEGDQVGADPDRGQGGAEATAQLGQGGGLAVELAGQDRGPQGVLIGPERPQGHAGVRGQPPGADPGWFRRQAAGTAGPLRGRAAGQAGDGPKQPAEQIGEEHGREANRLRLQLPRIIHSLGQPVGPATAGR
jgi:hypothetical protein